ncbi:ABC transporter permease [Sporolactobacillus laevolacticus]|jgi:peptide/nickel transport system permease protein|uniref:Peptide ABC transporter permease n=1 Tax=Sporolactobacillus laevolacticus DSM 442 TaxID=1395513 RepID=V6IU75_9BACL|nr:ABC transporter permease [Sporolactobacillus laevolacticus]EST10472.1 peptide ABC transporter permease [Sporolactobacillus laevolacticus DSM 442]MDF2910096.1 peptide transporter permease [Sporolactobacillus laevolacticus]MDN3955772.1 ABC transporter permease [Sporolactobacillus laevolacticus]
MKDFLIRLVWRIFSGILMVLAVASLTFFLVRMMPGDPVNAQYNQLIMQGMTPVQAENQVKVMYGFIPKEPVGQQFVNYILNLLHFDFGQSISYEGVSVSHIIVSAAPWTLVLVFTGLIASFLIGVLAGVIAAIKRSSPFGTSLTVSGSLLHGIPQFVMGLLLAYLFTTLWPLLPFGAPYDSSIDPGFNWPFISSLFSHAVLPVFTYALSSYGGWLLTMKSSVITVLGDDFILASEIRGLKASTRVGYIAHNAILPLFTLFTLSIGFMFGGSVFIENIFDYPGLGNLLLKSIDTRDYPLMSGAFLLITIAVILSNIITDFLYSIVDPRIRR